MMLSADCTKSRGTIAHRPHMTVKMTATPVMLHSGQGETQFPLLNSLDVADTK